MRIACQYPPAERFLKSAGMKQDDDGLWIFTGGDKALYKMQGRLHHTADGACLLFRKDGTGYIVQCHAHPGPYEGSCLETSSGGSGHGGGRDKSLK